MGAQAKCGWRCRRATRGLMSPGRRIGGLEKLYRQRRGLFGSGRAPVRALNGIDLIATKGETLAIVGESGCGKSTLAKVLAGLETASSGHVEIEGIEVASARVESRPLALKRTIQMVFQNPYGALNPRISIGRSVREPLKVHGWGDATTRDVRVREVLEAVGLEPEFASRRPRALSGGQRQRIAIARSLALTPELIILDEPVSALDVSVQAQILNLLADLRDELGLSYIFISHDLAVVRHVAERTAVMFLGRIVEFGRAADVFAPPFHPYTEALLSAVPVPDPDAQGARIVLEGPLPSATEISRGCPFSGRCPRRVGAICDETPPPTLQLASGHRIVCHIPAEELMELQSTGIGVNGSSTGS